MSDPVEDPTRFVHVLEELRLTATASCAEVNALVAAVNGQTGPRQKQQLRLLASRIAIWSALFDGHAVAAGAFGAPQREAIAAIVAAGRDSLALCAPDADDLA